MPSGLVISSLNNCGYGLLAAFDNASESKSNAKFEYDACEPGGTVIFAMQRFLTAEAQLGLHSFRKAMGKLVFGKNRKLVL